MCTALLIYYLLNFLLQLAPSKDKLDWNVLQIPVVTWHVIVLNLSPAHLFVMLMDASVQLEQS